MGRKIKRRSDDHIDEPSRNYDHFLDGCALRKPEELRTGQGGRLDACTISIGGQQAAVQSIAAPSGWHLLGRTPLRVFDMRRDPPFLIAPGDRVAFTPIDPATYDRLAERAERGEIVAEVEP